MPPFPASHTLSASNSVSNVHQNPFPFPIWYPESAHFVRQWWPTVAGVPRLSCTVVLLAAHDQVTHRTRFVLAQHYFKVPLINSKSIHTYGSGKVRHRKDIETLQQEEMEDTEMEDGESEDDALMRLWYVSTPFEVVCVLDGMDEDDEGGVVSERPRPLVAVDFGHAVWIEYVDTEEERAMRPVGETEAKWLRFVTFPSVGEGLAGNDDGPGMGLGMEGQVRTLEVPEELDLDSVETINIDQSQGAVILSVKEGKIFILCYE